MAFPKFPSPDDVGSFLQGAAQQAKQVAEEAAKAATDAAGDAAHAAQEAVKAAADTIGAVGADLGGKAGEAVKSVAESDAGQAAIQAVTETASGIPENVAKVAVDVRDGVVSTVSAGVQVIVDNSPAALLKRARIDGFRDGINQGAYLAGEKRFNFYCAFIATICYFLRIEGSLDQEEQDWLEGELRHLRLEGGVPDEVQRKMRSIAEKEDASFDDVAAHLDDVSLRSLDSIAESVQIAVEFDDVITVKEEAAQQQFMDYVESRAVNACVSDDAWTKRAIEGSVAEYEENIDRINDEFKNKTKLQDKDIAFLIGATMLQVARVLVINALTEVQAAGNDNKAEQKLHDAQDAIFEKFDKSSSASHSDELYASKAHILTNRGVPYDATAGAKQHGIFKGANHRFATLGHDPALGLIFGTANIMTNSISCVRPSIVGIGIPETYLVEYDAFGKNPAFGDKASTMQMLGSASRRVFDEPSAAAASLIKQLIHIGTDLYTPCGIQLPFANIILDNVHAEKLTEYVSTGDVLKVGGQAALAAFINWLVAALHGCSLIFQDNGEAFSLELYQARTKKIILLSNALATSSSVIQAAVTKNPKCFDLGGAAVLVYKLFTDAKFIFDLKRDFLNSGLDEIYQKRAEGILY